MDLCWIVRFLIVLKTYNWNKKITVHFLKDDLFLLIPQILHTSTLRHFDTSTLRHFDKLSAAQAQCGASSVRRKLRPSASAFDISTSSMRRYLRHHQVPCGAFFTFPKFYTFIIFFTFIIFYTFIIFFTFNT